MKNQKLEIATKRLHKYKQNLEALKEMKNCSKRSKELLSKYYNERISFYKERVDLLK